VKNLRGQDKGIAVNEGCANGGSMCLGTVDFYGRGVFCKEDGFKGSLKNIVKFVGFFLLFGLQLTLYFLHQDALAFAGQFRPVFIYAQDLCVKLSIYFKKQNRGNQAKGF
jgi:hypothetical protein